MELFLLLPDLQSKNFFYKKFLTFKNESKTGFENRKWNYPNRKWNIIVLLLNCVSWLFSQSSGGFNNRQTKTDLKNNF